MGKGRANGKGTERKIANLRQFKNRPSEAAAVARRLGRRPWWLDREVLMLVATDWLARDVTETGKSRMELQRLADVQFRADLLRSVTRSLRECSAATRNAYLAYLLGDEEARLKARPAGDWIDPKLRADWLRRKRASLRSAATEE